MEVILSVSKKEHEQTYTKYKEMLSKILQLLEEAVVPKGCENYFYMQQYVSLFANLEYFLYGTLMWETCQCYERYKKVMLLLKGYVRNKDIKSILNGEYSILQEITLVEQIKYVIYHKTKQVQELYKVGFDIDLDLDVLKKQIEIRHDIVHRMGYTKDDSLIQITKEDVISLTNKIVGLVDSITSKIKEVN